FFHFANGPWIKAHPIPADQPRWGTFNQLHDNNEEHLHQILEGLQKTTPRRGTNEQKLRDFYRTGMDTSAIEAAGLKPLQPELNRIAAIKDLPGVAQEVAELHHDGVNVLFEFGETQDFKDAQRVIGELDQGGLGLPDRDDYLKDDQRSKTLRSHYLDHVSRMLALLGDDPKTTYGEATRIMALETRLAKVSKPRAELRDPEANYHLREVAETADLTPAMDFPGWFSTIGLRRMHEVNVAQPEFFAGLQQALEETPLQDVRNYLRWHLVHAYAGALPQRFVDENFAFYGKTLTGVEVIKPRWKRMVENTDRSLGFALGQLYVKQYFPPEAKARVQQMVSNIQAALRDDLEQLAWMSPQTRQAAIAKMSAFTAKIGYPDKWRDYAKLKVDGSPFAINVMRAQRFDFEREMAKIGRPVDRTEWDMTPPTVNAYYNPSMNEIVFPAGILQPPFFDPQASDAQNYGAIGSVIGHEMTHGFDDQGAKFDGQGNLRDWWTADDLQHFHQRSEAIARQFDGYEVAPGVHLNGKLVTGEAIADLGGLTLAYRAYEHSLEGKPRPASVDGFTPEQQFFLGFAHLWAGSQRPELTQLYAKVDPHPAPLYRVNGTLSNMPQFQQAWGIPDGAPLAPANRTQIW
ncbi:MAG: M13 family metallopeptidase, partial [Candidatus Xenobia bacterium]